MSMSGMNHVVIYFNAMVFLSTIGRAFESKTGMLNVMMISIMKIKSR